MAGTCMFDEADHTMPAMDSAQDEDVLLDGWS
jgi:hypothetical protein